jgi:hypothetical protein
MTTEPRRRATRRSDTPPPKTGSDERDVLVGFLDYLRTSVAAKVEGVSEPTVRTPASRPAPTCSASSSTSPTWSDTSS